jgi:fibro-slime domain-containing protein
MRKLWFVVVVGCVAGWVAACGDSGDASQFGQGQPEGGNGDPPVPPGVFTPDGGVDVTPPVNDSGNIDCDADPAACLPPAVCGDGKPGLGESCDDGNILPGDGCSATCQIEAPYWACAFGSKCVDVRDCAALVEAGLADGGDGGCVAPPKPAVCGDGVIDPGEACDDGNISPGDGCSLDCKAIEADFVCPTPGAKCVSTVKCGDGKITGTETCDDGQAVPTSGDGCDVNCHVEAGWSCPIPGAACKAASCGDGIVAGDEDCDDGKPPANGDGCSATCTLEPGWKCPPATACSKTTCGDNKKEGTEQCDDGNLRPFDGCSPTCEVEPKCAGGVCTAVCGDGVKFPSEACDDGNLRDGDGCSSTCTLEPGFNCTNVASALPPTLDIPIIYRDTTPALNGDFESYCCGSALGMVSNLLAADGEPVFAWKGSPQFMTDAPTFAKWYHDGPTNTPIFSTLTLKRQGVTSSYVFDSNTDAPYVALGGFFPLDGKGFGNYGGSGHNFHFTSELRDVFTFAGGEVLNFSGDDDVWVFINGHLVVDIGGVHGAMTGSVTLTAGMMDLGSPFAVPPVPPAPVGLVVGGMYEFAVFQAERHTVASNYKLTLTGFVKQKTTCTPICGDAIKTKTEACDDGVNAGGYGKCAPGCVLGPYCGDKIVQNPPEICDDGVNLTPWTPSSLSTACGPGCLKPKFCGDGIVEGAFGETCDLGAANTDDPALDYNGCKTNCQPGPRCGDATVDAAHGEVCDNGFNITAYVAHPTASDCAPGCKKPRFCGDSAVDFPFEQCDRGILNVNDGSYNSCTTDCKLGPRCGDGIVQAAAGEQCDDGNRTNGDGCSAACLTEGIPPK